MKKIIIPLVFGLLFNVTFSQLKFKVAGASKNISDFRKVQLVFKSGVGFNSKKLFESVKGKVGFY